MLIIIYFVDYLKFACVLNILSFVERMRSIGEGKEGGLTMIGTASTDVPKKLKLKKNWLSRDSSSSSSSSDSDSSGSEDEKYFVEI